MKIKTTRNGGAKAIGGTARDMLSMRVGKTPPGGTPCIKTISKKG